MKLLNLEKSVDSFLLQAKTAFTPSMVITDPKSYMYFNTHLTALALHLLGESASTFTPWIIYKERRINCTFRLKRLLLVSLSCLTAGVVQGCTVYRTKDVKALRRITGFCSCKTSIPYVLYITMRGFLVGAKLPRPARAPCLHPCRQLRRKKRTIIRGQLTFLG